MANYITIYLPTRPQVDTIIAISILKRYGEDKFPGISEAKYRTDVQADEIEDEDSMSEEGILLIDVGGGRFDHHNKETKTTATNLIAQYLEESSNPALQKLIQLAERDDFYGKGTISADPLDRAFGFSGLVGVLNKKYVNDPEIVIETMVTILGAFIQEEEKRAFEMPKELEEKLANGKAETFQVKQRGKKLKCIFIETDNTSMAGFLRSKLGGGFDVVALKLVSGHINILTRPMQRVDLRSLAVLIRVQEMESQHKEIDVEPRILSVVGTYKDVPEWYYDTATNSLLNGGPNPQNIKATSIDPFEFKKLLEIGLSEQLWSPLQ